ncbi:phenylacetate--CoA ligase family protein [Nocardia higoensis]|uniref:phenylacetate--CoA ligase family protein n=1 Tax=Nocardia higoensis TaxID=228599 RepID=UPI0005935280|nr:phenylacetate--CoA ligase family protein [Nocardia higoensis]
MDHQLAVPGFDHALEVFRSAVDRVPAYAKFLCDHGIDAEEIRTPADFAALPPVTKDNYFQVHPRNDLMAGGDIGVAGIWSSSSGSTGRPGYWARDEIAHAQGVVLHGRILRAFGANRRRTLVVVAFAMGNWIGGTYTLRCVEGLAARGYPVSVIAPGQNLETVRADIAELGPYYEQVVLAGYPPFVRDVLDGAGPEVLSQDLKLLLAGENITETWRDRVLELMGKPGRAEDTCLIYGTADAGMMGHETPTTIAVRRAAEADPLLRQRLFGDATVTPTLVEYDPGYRYTETDEAGRLLFTVANAMPLVRYRINDEGEVRTAEQLATELLRAGHRLRVRTCTPSSGFLVLRGRPDVAATFYAVKIRPDGIRAALGDPRVRDELTGKFVLTTVTDARSRDELRLRVELRAGARPAPGFPRLVAAVVTGQLAATSAEYRELRRARGDLAEPVVETAAYGSAGFRYAIKHTGLQRAG